MRRNFLAAAALLLVIAAGCGMGSTKLLYLTSNTAIALGLVSLGFSVAGGFALLAAAVVKTD